MKSLGLVLALVLFSADLFAAPFDMISVGDPVLEDLRFLSLESGRPFLSFTPPLAPGEVKQFLAHIDVSLLSAPAQEAYSRIQNRLNPRSRLSLTRDFFTASLDVNLSFEVRARYNEDIAWYPHHPDIPSLLSLPLRLHFFDFLQLYFDPIVESLPGHYLGAGSFGTNVGGFDIRSPLRAYAAAGGSWWNFQLGRDSLSYGTGNMGNLAISDNPAFYDFMRISLFSRVFKYSSLVAHMPMDITDSLYEIQNPNSLRKSMNRYFYMHRFDINIANRLSIGLMEGLIVGNAPVGIRYLNPMIFFHSFYSADDYDYWAEFEHTVHSKINGSILSLELNWHIMRSLAVYGQFVMNQIALPTEVGLQPPDGFGYMAGIQYSHSFNTWASVFFFEFTSTMPYLYISSSPFASFIHMRHDSTSPDAQYYSFTGYPRDLMAFTLGSRFFNRDMLELSASFTVNLQGEHGNWGSIIFDYEWSEEAFAKKNPSGIVEEKYIASIAAQWRLLSFLRFNGSLDTIISRHNNHTADSHATGLQAAFSVSFSY